MNSDKTGKEVVRIQISLSWRPMMASSHGICGDERENLICHLNP